MYCTGNGMPTRYNARTDVYKKNEGDLLNNGRDDKTPSKAGASIFIDEHAGLSSTRVSIDGDLQAIDTAADARTLDPTLNTLGSSVNRHSRAFLLRWLVKLLQLVEVKLPTLSAGRIPVEQQFTVTTCTPSGYTATTTSGTLLAANSNRKSAVIVNSGSVDVYLSRSNLAVVNQGILLKASGGAYEINSTNTYLGVISAVTATGQTLLCVEEGV